MKKQRETAVVTMTDIHYGKKTNSFNLRACEQRLRKTGENIIRIKSLMTGYQFDELVICLLGDVNDGTDIYATQAHHQAESNVEEQAEAISDILADIVKNQKKVWGKVRVECVAGNHGRAGKWSHEAANWDVVAYKYLKAKVQGVPVGIGEQNKFLRTISVRGHRYLLYHGHEIKSFGNIPWYGMLLRTARWNTTNLAPFDAVMMGHFHTFGMWKFNKITAMINGTLITDDEWALQCLGWESANKWWMFGVSDHKPITWSFGLELN